MIQACFPGACGNTTCVVCQVPAATTCVKQGITPVPEADCSRACLALGFKSTGKKPTTATCSARVQPPSASCGSLQTFWRLGKEVSNEGGARLARTVARISSIYNIPFVVFVLSLLQHRRSCSPEHFRCVLTNRPAPLNAALALLLRRCLRGFSSHLCNEDHILAQ